MVALVTNLSNSAITPGANNILTITKAVECLVTDPVHDEISQRNVEVPYRLRLSHKVNLSTDTHKETVAIYNIIVPPKIWNAKSIHTIIK